MKTSWVQFITFSKGDPIKFEIFISISLVKNPVYSDKLSKILDYFKGHMQKTSIQKSLTMTVSDESKNE